MLSQEIRVSSNLVSYREREASQIFWVFNEEHRYTQNETYLLQLIEKIEMVIKRMK